MRTNSSNTTTPRSSVGSITRLTPASQTIIELASQAGVLSLNPSDLVFESSQYGQSYYDFVLSSYNLPSLTKLGDDESSDYQLVLAKLDSNTNVEWFETVRVATDLLKKNGIPINDLSLITMGVLLWRIKIGKAKLLCLVNHLGDESSFGLEALKRATNKFGCLHHVLTIGQRRKISIASSHGSGESSCRSSISSNSSLEGMKLRVMMCQSRNELTELPAQAMRETKFLLVPSSNPLLCLCFPLT